MEGIKCMVAMHLQSIFILVALSHLNIATIKHLLLARVSVLGLLGCMFSLFLDCVSLCFL